MELWANGLRFVLQLATHPSRCSALPNLTEDEFEPLARQSKALSSYVFHVKLISNSFLEKRPILIVKLHRATGIRWCGRRTTTKYSVGRIRGLAAPYRLGAAVHGTCASQQRRTARTSAGSSRACPRQGFSSPTSSPWR